MIIKPEILRRFVFKDSPKYWFHHIRRFLYKDIGKLSKATQYYNFNFIRYNIQSTIIFGKRVQMTYIYPGIPYSSTESSWKLRVPSGNLQFVEDEQFQSAYQFNLDNLLKLNITFDYIKIFSKIYYPDECYLGHLSLKNSNITTDGSKLKYCGRHSLMMCYPPYEKINISLSIRQYIFFDLKFSFSIIDQNNIVSCSVDRIKLIKPNLIQTIKYIQEFHLSTDKHKILVMYLHTKLNSVEIYDGPGTLSNKLQEKGYGKSYYKYVTTYFQCVIYIYDWNENNSIFKESVTYFTRKLISPEVISINFTQVLKFLFPNYLCFQDRKLCLLQVSTLPSHGINITINSINHTHNNNDLCTYSGIAAYIMNNHSNKEISTECKSKTNFYKYRNIYTNTSTILVVIYSFFEYGPLNLS